MNDERDEMQELADLYQQELWEQQMQLDLPPHKRSGYAERIYEMADDIRQQRKEAA